MHDPEERAEILKEYEALVPRLRLPEVQARMIAEGLDPEAELKRLAISYQSIIIYGRYILAVLAGFGTDSGHG
jgi:hypothetical protein